MDNKAKLYVFMQRNRPIAVSESIDTLKAYADTVLDGDDCVTAVGKWDQYERVYYAKFFIHDSDKDANVHVQRICEVEYV